MVGGSTVGARRAATVRPAVDQAGGVQPSSAASSRHLPTRSATGCAGLGGAGVGGRLPGDGGPLPAGGVPSFPFPEGVQLDGQRGVDLGGALGEHLQQLGGAAGDLGLTVDDRPPRHPVAVGQLGAQHRLVQAAEGPLLPFR